VDPSSGAGGHDQHPLRERFKEGCWLVWSMVVRCGKRLRNSRSSSLEAMVLGENMSDFLWLLGGPGDEGQIVVMNSRPTTGPKDNMSHASDGRNKTLNERETSLIGFCRVIVPLRAR